MFGSEEPVDVAANPASLDTRHIRFDGRQKGPVPRGIFGNRFIGRCGSGFDPACQLCDIFRRQPRAVFRGRHPIVIVIGDSFQDDARANRSGNVNRAAVTALLYETRRIKSQSTFLFERTVAGKTLLMKQRLDFSQIVHAVCKWLCF